MSESSREEFSTTDAGALTAADNHLRFINVAVQRYMKTRRNTKDFETTFQFVDVAGVKSLRLASEEAKKQVDILEASLKKSAKGKSMSSSSAPLLFCRLTVPETSTDATPASKASSTSTGEAVQPSEAQHVDQVPEAEPRVPPICEETLDDLWCTKFKENSSWRTLKDKTEADDGRFRPFALLFRDMIGPRGQENFRKCLLADRNSSTDIRAIEAQLDGTLGANASEPSKELLSQTIENNEKAELHEVEGFRLGCMSSMLLKVQWDAMEVEWEIEGSQAQVDIKEYSKGKGRSLSQGVRYSTLGLEWLVDQCENSSNFSKEDRDRIKNKYHANRSIGEQLRVIWRALGSSIFYHMTSNIKTR
jgi:hypothetical protein